MIVLSPETMTMGVGKILLLPLSVLYGTAIVVRNFLFHTGILKSRSFTVPVLCIGNITAGGTGKTPHTELLIAELKKKFRVACLSRGYKRNTSGFVMATPKSTAKEIGDEPMLIRSKFPDIVVACDGNRVRGIGRLLALKPSPEVIVMDDAFQHRYVRADKNIVLMDYNRPVYEDCLLPAGRLREPVSALKRADYIIVTKCPPHLQPIERRILSKHLKIKPYQQLFFTTLGYGDIRGLSAETSLPVPSPDSGILCVTGIANPAPYVEYLKTFTKDIVTLQFPDHHDFSPKDLRHIQRDFEKIGNTEKYIFTTEKDAVRFQVSKLPDNLKQCIRYIPAVPVFLQDKEVFFNEISEYVRKNQK